MVRVSVAVDITDFYRPVQSSKSIRVKLQGQMVILYFCK